MPADHRRGGSLQQYTWPSLDALTQPIHRQPLGNLLKLFATAASRCSGAPWLEVHAFLLHQGVEPEIDISFWLLSMLTHHPHPDQIVWLARRRWPLVDDPPRALGVLGDANPAEALASSTAKVYADTRTLAFKPSERSPDQSACAGGLDAPEICLGVTRELDAIRHLASARARSRRSPYLLERLSPRHTGRVRRATRTSQTIAVLPRLEPFEHVTKLPRPGSPAAKVSQPPSDRVGPLAIEAKSRPSTVWRLREHSGAKPGVDGGQRHLKSLRGFRGGIRRGRVVNRDRLSHRATHHAHVSRVRAPGSTRDAL